MASTEDIVFMDESDDEEIVIKPKPKKNTAIIVSSRPITDYIFINAKYYHFRSWHDYFPGKHVVLRSLLYNPDWSEFFDSIEAKPYYAGIERILSSYLTDKKHIVVPHAELVFNALNITSPRNIRVVIIGQDPYPGSNRVVDADIPDATGISFGVPMNVPVAQSLSSIYQNLIDHGHMKTFPSSGFLGTWSMQGCLMINSALTTVLGRRNAHQELWKNFTYDLLEYINTTCKNIVFLVWGKDAHKTCLHIDPNKHRIITSSHPSPMAFDKTVQGSTYGPYDKRVPVTYPAFKTTDHFGLANQHLVSVGANPIIWDLI